MPSSHSSSHFPLCTFLSHCAVLCTWAVINVYTFFPPSLILIELESRYYFSYFQIRKIRAGGWICFPRDTGHRVGVRLIIDLSHSKARLSLQQHTHCGCYRLSGKWSHRFSHCQSQEHQASTCFPLGSVQTPKQISSVLTGVFLVVLDWWDGRSMTARFSAWTWMGF